MRLPVDATTVDISDVGRTAVGSHQQNKQPLNRSATPLTGTTMLQRLQWGSAPESLLALLRHSLNLGAGKSLEGQTASAGSG